VVYRPKVDEKLCFVLMPFGHPFDSYYQKIIKPAASDAGLAALRSDEIYGRKAIVKDIWARIWAARIVVADVTDRNPNVNYELGLCDAVGVPTIIVASNIDDVPFDYNIEDASFTTGRMQVGTTSYAVTWPARFRQSLLREIVKTNLSGPMIRVCSKSPDLLEF